MGAKSQRLVAGSLVSWVRSTSAPLEDTCQSEGAMTWKVKLGLQVGLFEVREHPAGIGRFILGVEVALAVGGIDEAVHAFAAACCTGRFP